MAILCFDGNQNRLTGSLIDAYNKELQTICPEDRHSYIQADGRNARRGKKKGKNVPGAAVACGYHAGYFTYFNSLKRHDNPGEIYK